ncbi:hypothetical protein NTH58_004121 [Enterobacter oligotrophicus]|nr:hypothetical protein [Enterobacter oligotrophicus]
MSRFPFDEQLFVVEIPNLRTERKSQQMLQIEQQLNRAFTDKDRRALHYMILFSLVGTF